ncbi:MAG: ytrA 1 [Naasia sp.]|nr:ytrA 1 [Naasia sp.]
MSAIPGLLPSDPPGAERIRRAVVDAVRSGQLPPATRLPTVRGLAGELGIAPGTVAKAYRLLEQDGVVETGGRHGTRIAGAQDAARRSAEDAAARFAARAVAVGLSDDEAHALLTVALSNART